ncbi:MAG: MBL fold metallo-hydrolase [Candidatus Methylacidiphilales bacterium]|nr:MBL fold metallo-hydrolase [Candidatus Methylacidiphilales bacterium]
MSEPTSVSRSLTQSVEFHLLRVGSCRHREAVAMRGAPWRLIEFPALCGVFRHPDPRQGVVLYDTGYSDAFERATVPLPERFYRWMTPVDLPQHEQLIAQLGALGITPNEIKLVLISHFHADHVAGLRLFPNARLMCMRADWDWFRAMHGGGSLWGRLRGVRKGFLHELLPDDITKRLSFAEDMPEADLPPGAFLEPLLELGKPRDILGDGSMIAVPLPGHSCCQMGVIFRDSFESTTDSTKKGSNLKRQELTFLVSDACWSIRAVRENRPPSSLANFLVHSVAEYRKTFEVLCRIIKDAEAARLTAQSGKTAKPDPNKTGSGFTLALVPSHCTATFNEWSACRMRQVLDASAASSDSRLSPLR